MKNVGLFEAKTRLSELCREVSETGQEIIITRRGQTIARLVPPARPKARPARVPGRFKGQFGPLTVAESLAPLPPEHTGLKPSATDPLELP
ncbi:MAG: type II toxin-antitoxin system Phd/YefM family antitoxin [Verrucomicrobia bacterium]|nr:type II toxin-antitoxin system Phd/YefM family antitoxin [Verrucomicrobiota bacterium]